MTGLTHKARAENGDRRAPARRETSNERSCLQKRKNAERLHLALAVQTAENNYLGIGTPEWFLNCRAYEVTCAQLKKVVGSITDTHSKKSLKKVRFCDSCREPIDVKKFSETMTEENRSVNVSHLALFRAEVRRIVEEGWDRRVNIGDQRRVFIPNGAATLRHSRKKGGNWNASENKYSPLARIMSVPATGKDRAVSIFDESMSILRPAHKALYDSLSKRGVHVRGEFTLSDVIDVIESGSGHFVSGDYSSATDNIKKAYVKAVVDVLLEKCRYLNDEEKDALKTFGDVFDIDIAKEWQKGQPMGALMSFPVLCIWNRALFEMAFYEEAKECNIGCKEFSQYKQKINGDDIAFRELREGGHLMKKWRAHCELAGVVVNEEKTSSSLEYLELNSKTYRVSHEPEKVKTVNWKCLDLNRDCPDIMVIIADCVKSEGARMALTYYYTDAIRQSMEKNIHRLPEMYQTSLFHAARKGYFGTSKQRKQNERLAEALMVRGRKTGISQLVDTCRWSEDDELTPEDQPFVNAEKKKTIQRIRKKGDYSKKITVTVGDGDSCSWSSLTTSPDKRKDKVVMEFEFRVLREKLRRRLYATHTAYISGCVLPSVVKKCPFGARQLFKKVTARYNIVNPNRIS